LNRNNADAHEPFSICAAIIVKPIIIGAAERDSVGFFFYGRQIETCGRKKHAAFDTVAIHVFKPLVRIGGQVAVFICGRTVILDPEGRFVRAAVVTITFQEKQQLAIGDLFNSWSARTKRRLQITLPQIVGFPHVAIDIDYAHESLISFVSVCLKLLSIQAAGIMQAIEALQSSLSCCKRRVVQYTVAPSDEGFHSLLQ
jgi:hypothetical protein